MKAVTGKLTSTGWTSWDGVRAVLGSDRCLWVDLRGPQHGPAPAELPVGTTHLWSWRDGRWVRVRVDGNRALATVLTEGAGSGEAVTTTAAEGLPWGQHVRAAQWDRPVTLLLTEGGASITFAQLRSDISEGD